MVYLLSRSRKCCINCTFILEGKITTETPPQMPRGGERGPSNHTRSSVGGPVRKKGHRTREWRASRPPGVRCLYCQMVYLWFNSKRRKFQIVSKFLGKLVHSFIFSHASSSCVFFLTSLDSSCLPSPSCPLPTADMVTGGPCALGHRGCLGGGRLSRCPDVS